MHIKSDEDLRSIRAGLLAREAELHERMRLVEDDLRRQLTPLRRDASHVAAIMENDQVLQAVDEFARSELKQIERALERLEAGTYGQCDECGGAISVERLRAVPYSTHCRNCAADN
jgi:RNA polymerase-binding transcription factor DksA